MSKVLELERLNMDIKNVLVPTDFSPNARFAYGITADLCTRHHARAHVVHFASPPPLVMPQLDTNEYYQHLSNALTNEVESCVDFQDVPTTAHFVQHVLTGEALRQLEAKHSIDLIICATHGRTGVMHFVMGSFAEQLLRLATVPTLICRIGGPSSFEPKHVLVPFDFSSASLATLPIVRHLATRYACRFTFLYVHEPEPPSFFPMLEKVRQMLRSKLTDRWEERFSAVQASMLAEIEVHWRVEDGDPASQITRVANEELTDLVLMGTHGILGSVAQRVVRHAPGFAMTVPIANIPSGPRSST